MDTGRVIIGIDPGTTVMGYGIIRVTGKKIELLSLGVIKLNKYSDHTIRLQTIFSRVSSLIEQFGARELSIEAPFFGKNVQSMLKLGRAQGVAIAAALSKSVPYSEYSPRKIKQSITGKGSASKEQVAAMLSRLLEIRETPETFDATDALAAAICHHFQKATPDTGQKFPGWKSFIAANPDRIV